MSHNAPGSAERELHTPGGSRRRARLQEDLDAGAKIADELNKSADRSLTPPLSDGEFARLSSGEMSTDGQMSTEGTFVAGSHENDFFTRTSSCVYDKAKARERGRSYLGPKLSVQVSASDDSSAHMAVAKSLRSPEPPSSAPSVNNPRAAIQVRVSQSSPTNKGNGTGCLTDHKDAWPSANDGSSASSGWAVRPISQPSAKRSECHDSFARATSSGGSDSFKRPAGAASACAEPLSVAKSSPPKDTFVRAMSVGSAVPTTSTASPTLSSNSVIRKTASPPISSKDKVKQVAASPGKRVSLSRDGSIRLRPGSGAMVGDKSVGSRLSSSSGDRTRTNAHQSPPLDSPARHAKARADASSLALRANNDCPTYEGMLKVETHGEQRVRQLLYRQAIWLPAYCVLKDGVVTCSKDKRHTMVVDAFDMSETRVLMSDHSPKIIHFFVSTGSGEALVEFQAKTEEEARTWVKLCGIARKWAENNKRVRMGLMPLSDAASRIVGVRKIIKRSLAPRCIFFQ
eukprot:Tamp_05722.p1 GENE.Tamp_05722~~Tamp_05722.p1  ORF type:complete len:603 (+),score=42.05 Tamp_05722:270-1811(+)